PSNFNTKAFMDDLKNKGISKTNRMGPTQFFAELKSRGVSLPSNFNQTKFIEESERKGIEMPDMVDWHRNF
ncbi:MAG TPA: hypothetical protein VG758_17780, partial [Hyphomicrobiaceae bacterium]|nr:hypothetical protein [Hyphomicrobiaceae bacterium]